MGLTEQAALQVLKEHFETMFPRNCSGCGRRFNDLREYFHETHSLGSMICNGGDAIDSTSTKPLLSITFANCTCGTTVTLSTMDMDESARCDLLQWLREEMKQVAAPPNQIFSALKLRLRRMVLEEQQST